MLPGITHDWIALECLLEAECDHYEQEFLDKEDEFWRSHPNGVHGHDVQYKVHERLQNRRVQQYIDARRILQEVKSIPTLCVGEGR